MKKSVLITGGFGLLGQSLSENLDQRKFNIFVLDKIKNKKRNSFLYNKNLNIIHGDFNDKNFIFNIIKKKKNKNNISYRCNNSSSSKFKKPKRNISNKYHGNFKYIGIN